MKYFAALIVFVSIGYSVNAQQNSFIGKSHIGFAVGAMNYLGFMNTKPVTLDQAKLSGELAYRYDVTSNFHVRVTLMGGSLAKDNGVYSGSGVDRSGSFSTGIFEADVLPEYNFLDLKSHKITPYIFMGGGFYTLTNYQKDNQSYDKPNKSGINFRGGLGVKYKIKPAIELFLEGSRREFSKSIDFYESKNSPSRYYSFMIGANFSLSKSLGKDNLFPL